MNSRLGTPLPRGPVAWFWFAVFALPAMVFGRSAFSGQGSWVLPAILGAFAVLIVIESRLRKREFESVQVDD